jgi:hypothetical protein
MLLMVLVLSVSIPAVIGADIIADINTGFTREISRDEYYGTYNTNDKCSILTFEVIIDKCNDSSVTVRSSESFLGFSCIIDGNDKPKKSHGLIEKKEKSLRISGEDAENITAVLVGKIKIPMEKNECRKNITVEKCGNDIKMIS